MDTIILTQAVTFLVALSAAGSALFAFRQARVAMKAVKQQSLTKLFSTFDIASQVTINNPELLYKVHGLPRSIPAEEAINIAYLSFLLDGFQHYYGEFYKNDFSKMEVALKKESVFLNRVLSNEENQSRWNILKETYYGSFDLGFCKAIDSLIKHEQAKSK